jgi:hypothetical protein
VLRLVLGQPDALREWRAIDTAIASALVEGECLRTLDRLRLGGGVSDRDLAERREVVFDLLRRFQVVEIDRLVLARAALPLPTTLGTLDAIHLATAALWREPGGRHRDGDAPHGARHPRPGDRVRGHRSAVTMRSRGARPPRATCPVPALRHVPSARCAPTARP